MGVTAVINRHRAVRGPSVIIGPVHLKEAAALLCGIIAFAANLPDPVRQMSLRDSKAQRSFTSWAEKTLYIAASFLGWIHERGPISLLYHACRTSRNVRPFQL